jgi:host factor-I protein
MDAEARNLQNDFFNTARKERSPVTVFLGNGKKLVGRIKSFDKFTILLESQQGDQIIFKHAISTVSAASRPAAVGAPDGDSRRRAEPVGSRPLDK